MKISEAVNTLNGTELSRITFKNLPTDAVVGSNGEEIGEIHFSGTDAVTFTAYTQKKDSYKAYRDELTDLPRSGQQPTDSIPAPEKK